MQWLSVIPVVLIGIGALTIPGLIAGLTMGLRGHWLVSLSAPFSATLFLIASVTIPLFGFDWKPSIIIPVILLLSLLSGLLYRLFLHRPLAERSQKSKQLLSRSDRVLYALIYGVPAVTLTLVTVLGVGSPANISQTFDNIFHLNILAYIGDTQNASPLWVGTLTSPHADTAFYPNVWHIFVSFVAITAQTEIPIAVNAMNIAALIAVLPAGVASMATQFAGSRPYGLIGASVAGSALPAFPLYLIHYGVLYPYFFAILLLPASVALVVQLVGLSRDVQLVHPWGIALLLIAVLPGLAISHPSALMALLALSVPLAICATFAGWSAAPLGKKWIRIATLALYGVIGLFMLIRLRTPAEGLWNARMPFYRSIFEVLTLQFFSIGVPFLLAAMMLVGIVVALISKHPLLIAAVGMWVVSAGLYVLTAGRDSGRLKLWLASAWYGDSPRLAPLVALCAIILVALASAQIATWVPLLQRDRWVSYVGFTVVIALIAMSGAGYPKLISHLNKSYSYTDKAALLSIDEHTLLQRLDEQVDTDKIIVGSPWTGTSLAYAFSGSQVLTPHIFTHLDSDGWTILNRLDEAHHDPTVCEAIERLNVGYYLDFGDREVHGGNNVYTGFDELDNSSILTEIDRENDAVLYGITACD